MRTYCYERIDKNIQELMQILATDYPNNAELVITPTYAAIRYMHIDMNFTAKRKGDDVEQTNGGEADA